MNPKTSLKLTESINITMETCIHGNFPRYCDLCLIKLLETRLATYWELVEALKMMLDEHADCKGCKASDVALQALAHVQEMT